jgi:hypothetical protein
MASPAEKPAVPRPAGVQVTESPDWPTVFHPPGVIRLVTPAEEQAALRCARSVMRLLDSR